MKGQRHNKPCHLRRPRGISPVTIRRLSLYLRHLEDLAEHGQTTVSSRQLGESLKLTAAQVRKDLAYFGQFGRPGVGYQIRELAEHLRSILGTDTVSNVAIVGVGSLGRALLRYRGWRKKGFQVVAAFDVAPSRVGKRSGNIVIQHISRLPATVRKGHIRMAILAVPAVVAQKVAELLCRCGIEGILNFAPLTLAVPEGVAVVAVDLAVQLEQLNYLVNTFQPGAEARWKTARAGQS